MDNKQIIYPSTALNCHNIFFYHLTWTTPLLNSPHRINWESDDHWKRKWIYLIFIINCGHEITQLKYKPLTQNYRIRKLFRYQSINIITCAMKPILSIIWVYYTSMLNCTKALKKSIFSLQFLFFCSPEKSYNIVFFRGATVCSFKQVLQQSEKPVKLKTKICICLTNLYTLYGIETCVEILYLECINVSYNKTELYNRSLK